MIDVDYKWALYYEVYCRNYTDLEGWDLYRKYNSRNYFQYIFKDLDVNCKFAYLIELSIYHTTRTCTLPYLYFGEAAFFLIHMIFMARTHTVGKSMKTATRDEM